MQERANPAHEAAEVPGLKVDLAAALEPQYQAFAGEEGLFDTAHAADGVGEPWFPGDDVAGIDDQFAAVQVAFDHAAVGVEEEFAGALAFEEEGTFAREERAKAAEAGFELDAWRAGQERRGGEDEALAGVERAMQD